MRRSFALCIAICACFAALAPAQATAHEAVVYELVEEWVVPGDAGPATGAERFVGTGDAALEAGAAYGPFRVLDENRAALVGITDGASPDAFAAMLHDHPSLATLELLDCPGTFDDLANLQLGRMIRDAGLGTYVPADGSVRSGAVELFLAGATRRIDDGAEFAVHAWEDDEGLEATDFAADAPENRKYIAYYEEMGMDEAQAIAFYAMTNSVPFERALWLDADDMRRWLPDTQSKPELAEPQAEPKLAYLDPGQLDFAGLPPLTARPARPLLRPFSISGRLR